jgi:hypothetical protein
MRQLSKVTHSREQWKHTATQRGARERSQRQQIVRLPAERDRAPAALQEAQAPLRQCENHHQALGARPQGALVFVALQLFLVARLGLRALSRVLSLLAWALGINKAPCPHTSMHWGMRRALVRIAAARRRTGLPLRPEPLSHGRVWMLDRSIGLGTGKIVAVLAFDAPHPHLAPGALSVDHGHCLGGSVADAWTGDTMATWLGRLIAVRGRPAASLQDGGGARHNAVAILGAQGLTSPCLDDIAHAVAGRRKRSSQAHPTFEPFGSAWGRVSGTLTHTILACLAPPKVRTTARFLQGHRLGTWADRVLKLSPGGGAKRGSPFAKVRACLDPWPACKALITRCRTEAFSLLAGQKLVKTPGRSHATRGQGAPLIEAMPSAALRLECRAYLDFPRETATTLGLDHVGLPSSADPIASLFGVAKRHGVGATPDAARMALRRPAFCGVPTRKEAAQVLQGSGARQQACTAQFTSLILLC